MSIKITVSADDHTDAQAIAVLVAHLTMETGFVVELDETVLGAIPVHLASRHVEVLGERRSRLEVAVTPSVTDAEEQPTLTNAIAENLKARVGTLSAIVVGGIEGARDAFQNRKK